MCWTIPLGISLIIWLPAEIFVRHEPVEWLMQMNDTDHTWARVIFLGARRQQIVSCEARHGTMGYCVILVVMAQGSCREQV